ncbi:TPA: hypothetical protein QH086_001902 [Klebsiella pneumoniae subsp. pneumoniae]|nr:hypothetical protein [Klebsiella pneumoniae subsp. pneumoniae]HDU4814956.1 hypothetical protein [Klebsiella pneumoniae subsp. pneumoniae]
MNIETVNELIASLESAGELSIRELAKAYQQLAAENVAMIRLLTDISDNHVEYFSEGEGTMFAGVPLDYVSEINMYVSRDVNAENPFPATDRIVAGIKADAIDEAAVELDRVDTVASTRVIGFKLREFSQQLREGAK